jgi:Transposase and inactivated derivatives
MLMKSYSMDLRERIISSRQSGNSAAMTARIYKVSKRTVERLWARFLSDGTREARKRGGYKKSHLLPFFKDIKRWLKEDPCMTLAQMSDRCALEFGIIIKSTALWQQLDKLGLSFKKNDTRQRARQARREGAPRSMEAKPAASRRKKTGVS